MVGVTTGAVELSNALGFSPDVFASTQEVSIRVKIIPLLSKKLEMDTISINGLTLNLSRDDTGKTNWDDLSQENNVQPTTDGSAAGIDAMAIGGLDVSNASISWHDATMDQLIKISTLMRRQAL